MRALPRATWMTCITAAVAAAWGLGLHGDEPAADGTTSVVVPAVPAVSTGPAVPAAHEPPRGAAGSTTGAVTSEASSPPTSAAIDLLGQLLEPRPDADAPTRPLPLLEALERPGDRSRRLWIVQAYWKAAVADAAVRSAEAAFERLELVAPGSDPHDRAVLDVATAAARADLADARARLAAARQELVDLARLPPGDPLPRPVDLPLAIPYETHFDAIFANRIATGRIRTIARTLPLRHEALEARALAVTAAAEALAMAEADHAKATRPIEAVVAAHAALVVQEREFLEAVRAYNLDIAEYGMAVVDLAVPDDAFVSVLIGTPTRAMP
jgi:hypothetical protein